MKTVKNLHEVPLYTNTLIGFIGFGDNDEIFFPLRTLYPSRTIPHISSDIFEKEYRFYGEGGVFKAFMNTMFDNPEKKFSLAEERLRNYADAVLNPLLKNGFKITVGDNIYLETAEGNRVALKFVHPEIFLIISPHFEFFVQFSLFYKDQSLDTIKIKRDKNGIEYKVYLDKVANEFTTIMSLSNQSPYSLVYGKVKEVFVRVLYLGESNPFLNFFVNYLARDRNALGYVPFLGTPIEAELIEKHINRGYFSSLNEDEKLVKGLIYINSKGKKDEELLFEAFDTLRPLLKKRVEWTGENINHFIHESNNGFSYSFAPDSFDSFNALALSLDSYEIEHKEEIRNRRKIVI